jgi:hypothetical protein
MEGREADPSRWRVSDKERHAVAEALREAAGEGRIDLNELEERLEATYAAKTYADLVPLTSDLPAPHRPGATVVPRPAAPLPVLGPSYDGSFAMMSETRRAGPWQVSDSHWAVAVMGSVVIDLRHAIFHSREVVITANALMGSVEVIVNPHTHVIVEGVGVMGDFNEGRSRVLPEAGPDSPVVRVRGVAFMGSVQVKRKVVRGRR